MRTASDGCVFLTSCSHVGKAARIVEELGQSMAQGQKRAEDRVLQHSHTDRRKNSCVKKKNKKGRKEKLEE